MLLRLRPGLRRLPREVSQREVSPHREERDGRRHQVGGVLRLGRRAQDGLRRSRRRCRPARGRGGGVFVDEAVARFQRVAHDDAGGAQSLGASDLGFEGAAASFDQDVSAVEGGEGRRGGVEDVGVARGVGIVGGAEGFSAEAGVIRGGQGELVGGVVFGYVVAAAGAAAAAARLVLVGSQMIQCIRKGVVICLFGSFRGGGSEVRSGGGDAVEKVDFDASSGGRGGDGQGGRAADVEVAGGGG